MPQKIDDKILSWIPEDDIEPQAASQLRMVAGMPFIFHHVAVMPDCHMGIGATVGSCIPTSRAVIPAAVGVDIGCLVGDTRIPLLNGRQHTLKELTELGEFWVYAIDQTTSHVVPAKARCLKTRTNAELIRVVVSGGDEITCTPDHEFMMSDGSWKQAAKLIFNDSLMPLYRRWQSRDGYESVSNGKGMQQMTHYMVYQSFNDEVPAGHVVHHKNHNHYDNRPENLEQMSIAEHSRHHREHGRKFDNANPDFQIARLNSSAKSNLRPERQAQMAEVGARNIRTYMDEQPEHFAMAVKDNGKRGAPVLVTFNTTPRQCDDCSYQAENPAALRWHKKREHGYNHKVLSIEPVPHREDVYCLQVEKHHNFALAAGVFVHNCGMIAVQTSLSKEDVPANLTPVREAIETAIPLSAGQYNPFLTETATQRVTELKDMANENGHLDFYNDRSGNWPLQIGSLGSGNHFIELVYDENDQVWAFLHSGSRGVGNKIAQHYISVAKKLMEKWFIELPDPDLAYLPQDTQEFRDYLTDLKWAQAFAKLNRAEMMDRVLDTIRETIGPFDIQNEIDCHHNFTQWENHMGHNVLISRKGAIQAREGQYGLIPGSMGTRSYVVRGKGNIPSFNTAPHGAGRRMARNVARKTLTMDDFDREMQGIEVRRSEAFLDELPSAYKSIDTVMERSADLVEVIHELRQFVNVKGESPVHQPRAK